MVGSTSVKWISDLAFAGTSASGHRVVVDSGSIPADEKAGAGPMELILLGAGGCASANVVQILKKSRVGFSAVEVRLSGQRAEHPPRVFTDIHLHFVVSGNDLPNKPIARAVDLAINKYCSATNMLAKAVTLTHSFEIQQATT